MTDACFVVGLERMARALRATSEPRLGTRPPGTEALGVARGAEKSHLLTPRHRGHHMAQPPERVRGHSTGKGCRRGLHETEPLARRRPSADKAAVRVPPGRPYTKLLKNAVSNYS